MPIKWSYCQFENTAKDMKDCINTIKERDVYELSSYEVKALEEFLILAHEPNASQVAKRQ